MMKCLHGLFSLPKFLATFLGCIFLSFSATTLADPPPPTFRTAAEARAWGERQERAGNLEAAGQAYEQESALLRSRAHDPQGAEAEHRRANRLRTDLALAVPVAPPPSSQLAKLEPNAGCYLGVLDNSGGGQYGSADSFAERTGHPVAVAFDYNRYGTRFPSAWAQYQASRGRAIQIAWEPEGGLNEVQDDAYLTRWAEDAAHCGTGVFLRFAGEMNGGWTRWGRDPAAYKRAFRTVHAVMARTAPNVAMVWAPNAVPVSGVDAYYPGDDAVDWVGLSLYLVRFYDDNLSRPAYADHPLTFIAPFYDKYAARKPLCLVECGISRRSRVEGVDADLYAAARTEDLLDAFRVRFPRLKMACWFDRNNLTGARPERRLNDYSLPEGSAALASYRQAVADPYFLGHFAESAPVTYQRLHGSLLPGSHGPILASLTTYALDAHLRVQRGTASFLLSRPYRFALPPGNSPLTVAVVDKRGKVAATVRVK